MRIPSSLRQLLTSNGVQLPRRPSKYRNVRTQALGKTFASAHEADAYKKLFALQTAGIISSLRCQVTYSLTVNGILITSYRADFVFLDQQGNTIVADAKGLRTEVYKLKKRLMLAVHGISILEL